MKSAASYEKGGTRVEVFRAMLEAYLLPLLFGVDLSGPENKQRGPLPPVSYNTKYRLRIALEPHSRLYFTMLRKVPFSEAERAFVERVVIGLHEGAGGAYDYSLMNSAVERAIAHAVNPEHADILFHIFQVYKEWSAPENRGVAHTVGLYFARRGRMEDGDFFSLRGEDCLKGMGASQDTLMALSQDGGVLGIEKIPPAPSDGRKIEILAAPLNLANLALWASSRRKAAVRLTADGTIFVFADKRLLFVRRGEFWRSLPHSLAGIEEMMPARERSLEDEVSRAVYLTSLDLAFAGQPACMGIFPDQRTVLQRMPLVAPDALLTSPNPSGVTRLLAGLVGDKKFQNIARRFRMEMCSMGGVLLMDAVGNVLAAGLRNKDGGMPDPDKAAARVFAEGGFGVAISGGGLVNVYGACYAEARG